MNGMYSRVKSVSPPSTLVRNGRCSLDTTVRKWSTLYLYRVLSCTIPLIISYQDVRSVLSFIYVEHVRITAMHEENLIRVDFRIPSYPRLRNVPLNSSFLTSKIICKAILRLSPRSLLTTVKYKINNDSKTKNCTQEY